MPRVRRAREDQGSTLIEILIAVAIMGSAIVALLTGTGVLFRTSALSRQATTSGIVARNYAEALSSAAAQTSAWCSTTPTGNPYAVSYTPPTGFSVAAAYGSCPTNNATTVQIQTVTITATSPNGGTEVVKTIVREP